MLSAQWFSVLMEYAIAQPTKLSYRVYTVGVRVVSPFHKKGRHVTKGRILMCTIYSI